MQIFYFCLLIVTHLLCSPLPTRAIVPDDGSKDLWVHDDAAPQTLHNVKEPSFLSSLNPSYIIESIQNAYIPSALHLSNVFQTFVTREPSLPDFWESAQRYEEILQEYVPRLVKSAAVVFQSTHFTEITATMQHIVNVTAKFRNNIEGPLYAHNVTFDMLVRELEDVFMVVANDMKNIPPLDDAPNHGQRTIMVDQTLDDTAIALKIFASRYGIEEGTVEAYLSVLKPHVRALVVTVGDINEQHPQLLSALLFAVVGLLIPESWILRPFLSLFGFGPSGPVKGSAAAWLQRRIWGSAVKSGTWFAWLQAAGMGVIPKWPGPVTKLTWMLGAVLVALVPCLSRR